MANMENDIVEETNQKIAVVSFYSFVDITEPELLIPKILYIAKRKSVKGTILLSEEGFNGSLSGEEEFVNLVIDELVQLSGATEVSRKTNFCEKQPFVKVKVKLKDEIVALKAGKIDVNGMKGEYISSKEWDDFIARDDVILIDTRNDYEVEVGTFKGAINPLTDTFRQFPKWTEENKDLLAGKKIAMCCTGGIRCEKSTAYLKQLGYEDVYHLEGGILQYLEDTKNESGFWQGECFVFDPTTGKEIKIFNGNSGKDIATQCNTSLLATIPITPKLAAEMDNGNDLSYFSNLVANVL